MARRGREGANARSGRAPVKASRESHLQVLATVCTATTSSADSTVTARYRKAAAAWARGDVEAATGPNATMRSIQCLRAQAVPGTSTTSSRSTIAGGGDAHSSRRTRCVVRLAPPGRQRWHVQTRMCIVRGTSSSVATRRDGGTEVGQG